MFSDMLETLERVRNVIGFEESQMNLLGFLFRKIKCMDREDLVTGRSKGGEGGLAFETITNFKRTELYTFLDRKKGGRKSSISLDVQA